VLGDAPAGTLLLSEDEGAIREAAAAKTATWPQLAVDVLDPDALREAEPALGPGLWACRAETGHPVAPAAATLAFAARARRAGATLQEGVPARPWIADGRARGVEAGGEHVAAGAVLVTAGPWTAATLGDPAPGAAAATPAALGDAASRWPFITPVWGLNVEVMLEERPRHALEELGIAAHELGATGDLELFSLIPHAGIPGVSSLGTAFLPAEPDPAAQAARLVERGARFVPVARDAPVRGTRTCARPVSPDGRPILGAVPGVADLHVATGLGPWGISVGPACAWLTADALLGGADPMPSQMAAARIPSG
jgi:glycine/D-amino acid oxidase-like deaminating enzyme